MGEAYSPDGSFDFSAGVNSSKVTTIQSQLTVNGLKRNELAWLQNGTVRGGGITQRTGWMDNGAFNPGGHFQGGYLYRDTNQNISAIVQVDGYLWRFDVDDPNGAQNLTVLFGLAPNPITREAFFCQAEMFLIVQAGDNKTLPLIWDGATLRRSNGITGNITRPNINEIPPATSMDYYQGRLWYALGRGVYAGDIVRGPTGTLPYNLYDGLLTVTESPTGPFGDGFTVPADAGNIRALKHSANINTQLGQGQLYIFTRKQIFSLTTPLNRADWVSATATNPPVMSVVQINNGTVSDRSVVAINGDLFYTSLDPAIRSLTIAVRNFQQWGNKPISANIDRALQFSDRALMFPSSGIEFNNRLWETILPKIATDGKNVVFPAVTTLDFDLISSLELETAASPVTPAWEGMYEGEQILQLLSADFGGLDRAFALSVSIADNSLHCWELTIDQRFEKGENRVQWYIEFPAFTWGKEFELKRLVGGEFWIDKLFGTTQFTFKFRGDADPCWHPWFATTLCSAKNCKETVDEPCTYPTNFREGYKFPITLPRPNPPCDSMGVRPANIAHQFQVRLEIKGWCRIRGLMLYAEPFDKSIYEGLEC